MYEMAFQMFDLNGDGEVSPEEFDKVGSCLTISVCLFCLHIRKLLVSFLVSSVGWVPDCCAGGREFEPWPDQHSGS